MKYTVECATCMIHFSSNSLEKAMKKLTKHKINHNRLTFGDKSQMTHNQCDLCDKKFETALGFHKHYVWCLTEQENGKP